MEVPSRRRGNVAGPIKLLSVDPGTRNTGYAIYKMVPKRIITPDSKVDWELVDSGTNRRPKALSKIKAVEWQLDKLAELVVEYNINELWTELYYPFKTKGGTPPKGMSENLMLVGGILGFSKGRFNGLKSYGVTARVWKQTMKEVDCPIDTKYDHESDAIRLALFAIDNQKTKEKYEFRS